MVTPHTRGTVWNRWAAWRIKSALSFSHGLYGMELLSPYVSPTENTVRTGSSLAAPPRLLTRLGGGPPALGPLRRQKRQKRRLLSTGAGKQAPFLGEAGLCPGSWLGPSQQTPRRKPRVCTCTLLSARAAGLSFCTWPRFRRSWVTSSGVLGSRSRADSAHLPSHALWIRAEPLSLHWAWFMDAERTLHGGPRSPRM